MNIFNRAFSNLNFWISSQHYSVRTYSLPNVLVDLVIEVNCYQVLDTVCESLGTDNKQAPREFENLNDATSWRTHIRLLIRIHLTTAVPTPFYQAHKAGSALKRRSEITLLVSPQWGRI